MGGYRLINRICNRCNTDFQGIWNEELCSACKTNGYEHVCNHCNVKYLDEHRYRKYCPTCTTNRVWQKNKKRPKEVGEKITQSKLKYYQTTEGKETAKSVGKQNSVKLKEYYQTSIGISTKQKTAKKVSKKMKQKIIDGTFTPKITNTFTHWTAEIEVGDTIRRFRSSWEAVLWYSNQHWEYETIRIPYIDQHGNRKAYIVDFYDPKTKTLIEVKPKSNIQSCKLKIKAAEQYCLENSKKFIIITESDISSYINESIFTGNNKKQLDKCYGK